MVLLAMTFSMTVIAQESSRQAQIQVDEEVICNTCGAA